MQHSHETALGIRAAWSNHCIQAPRQSVYLKSLRLPEELVFPSQSAKQSFQGLGADSALEGWAGLTCFTPPRQDGTLS